MNNNNNNTNTDIGFPGGLKEMMYMKLLAQVLAIGKQ